MAEAAIWDKWLHMGSNVQLSLQWLMTILKNASTKFSMHVMPMWWKTDCYDIISHLQGVKILFNPIFWQNPILSYFWEMPYFILFFGHFAFNFGIFVWFKESDYSIVVCNTHFAILQLFQTSGRNLF